MTENENIQATFEDAIYCAKSWAGDEFCEECRLYPLCHTFCDDVAEIIVKALEELKQYRAIGTVSEIMEMQFATEQEHDEVLKYRTIGTVEQLKTMFDGYWKLKDLCEEYEKYGLPEDYWKLNEMCKEYSAIGTVDEFKALKEKDEDLRLKYCYEDLSEADNLGYMRGYNKAIDEFADELINHSIYADIGKGNEVKMEWASPVTRIKEVAEQMKGGAE